MTTTDKIKVHIGPQVLLATTAAELTNKNGLLTTERNHLKVAIVIRDIRFSYGRTDVLIEPIEGAGQAWVSLDRIQLT
jgi:hypothetical protein